MKKLLTLIAGIALGGLLIPIAYAATQYFITQQGGTGTTSPSGILFGDNGLTNHLNTLKIGTGLSLDSGTLNNSILGQSVYYLYATQATSSAKYFNADTNASTTVTLTQYPTVANGTILQNYITAVGNPGVTVIPAGTYSAELYAARYAGSAAIDLKVQFWETDANGVDIAQIGTDTNLTPDLTASVLPYFVFMTTGVHTQASVNSRIVMRVITVNTGTPSVSLSVGDGADSNFVTPATSVNTTNFVPYSGATGPLNLGTNSFSSYASTTIGGGTAVTGLTVNGGATTTGNLIMSNGDVVLLNGRLNLSNITSNNTLEYLNSPASSGQLYLGSRNNIVFLADNDANGVGVIAFKTQSNTQDSTSNTRMLIDNTGRVGIATTSPYSMLSVAGQVVAQNYIATSTTLASIFQNATTSNFTNSGATWLTNLGTPAGAFLAVDANGKVIATTTPVGGSSFAYLFPNNSTTTGLGIYSSTTIGNGTSATGLTISGDSTTTGNTVIGTNVDLGSLTRLKVLGSSNTMPLQEWGDGGVVWSRIGRTSGNVMYMDQANYSGLDFEFRGKYIFKGTGTTTYSGDINLPTGKCYQVNGVCIGTVGGAASTTLLADNNTFLGKNLFTGASTTIAALTAVNSTTTNATTTNLAVTNMLGVANSFISSWRQLDHRIYVCASTIGNTSGCDYVATGSGDQVQIQAGYEAAAALGGGQGGSVYLSAGVFNVSGTTTLDKNNVQIHGEGLETTTILVSNSCNCSVFAGSSTQALIFNSIRDITLDGNSSNNANYGYGIYIPGTPGIANHFWDFTVRDVWAKNFRGDGFWSYDGHGFVLDHFLSEYNKGNGITFAANGVDEVEVQNGTIKFNGGIGIAVYGNGDIVQNNEVSDNGSYGIEAGGIGQIISQNVVFQNVNAGIHVTAQAYSKIVGNIVKANQKQGIFVDTSDVTVLNNSIFGNSTSTHSYSEIEIAHHRGNVSNNTIDGQTFSNYGINFSQSWTSGNVASNNTIINENVSATQDLAVGTTWNNGGNSLYAMFYGVQKFVMTIAGNMGIGSTTPWATFSVQGSAAQTNPLLAVASSTGVFQQGIDWLGTTLAGVQNVQHTNMAYGTTTLSAGLSTVSTTRVKADSMIHLDYCGAISPVTLGATTLSIKTKTAATSFVASSSAPTDTSTICWEIYQPSY